MGIWAGKEVSAVLEAPLAEGAFSASVTIVDSQAESLFEEEEAVEEAASLASGKEEVDASASSRRSESQLDFSDVHFSVEETSFSSDSEKIGRGRGFKNQ